MSDENSSYRNVSVIFECQKCGKKVSIRVNEGDYWSYYRDGESSEEAFPYLSGLERELLDSSLCQECLQRHYPHRVPWHETSGCKLAPIEEYIQRNLQKK